jgi:hypothetical protein
MYPAVVAPNPVVPPAILENILDSPSTRNQFPRKTGSP